MRAVRVVLVLLLLWPGQGQARPTSMVVAKKPRGSKKSLFQSPAVGAQVTGKTKNGTRLFKLTTSRKIQTSVLVPGRRLTYRLPAGTSALRNGTITARRAEGESKQVLTAELGLVRRRLKERVSLGTSGETYDGMVVNLESHSLFAENGETYENVSLTLSGDFDLVADKDGVLERNVLRFADPVEKVMLDKVLDGKADVSFTDGRYNYYEFPNFVVAVHRTHQIMTFTVKPVHDRVWITKDSGLLVPASR